jgi:Family of unknown function (DUF5681)
MSNTEYRVGRGKPPLGSRFKPGASGNPGGRPKRAPTLRRELLDELARPVAAGGDETKQRAIARTLVKQAIAGNLRALSVLVAVLARMPEPKEEAAEQQLSEHDREILEKYAQQESGTPEECEATDEAGEKGGPAGGDL